jgi:uncharacterized protein (TIRG00374 family)
MNKKHLLATLAVVALLAFFAHLQFRTWRDFDWQTFFRETRQTDVRLLLTGVALIYFTYYLRALRWKVMLKPDKKVPGRQLVGAQVIGFTSVAVLGRPGDLVRPYVIAKKHGLPLSSQIGVLAVERIFDTGAFALVLILDLLFARNLQNLPHYQQFRLAGMLLAVGTAGFAFFMFLIWRNGEMVASWCERLVQGFSASAARSLRDKILKFSDGLHTIHDVRSFAQLLLLSLAIWLVIALAYIQVTHAYPAPLRHMTIAHVVLVMSASIAGSMLQLPMVGGGSQLATISVMENVFGIPKELALSCGIMLWLITFAAVVPIGLVWARIEHVNLREAEHEAEESAR